MSLILILFFTSLVCIIIMIGRKLIILRSAQGPSEYLITEKVLFEIPFVREIRYSTAIKIKKIGHASLVMTIRYYIRTNNFLKNKYEDAKIKLKKRFGKGKNGDVQKDEENKFLKKITNYKLKIREIKNKIREEEKGI